ncbi:GNAT family N-acetyltransferase ['Osedax' symbiont bacterium Rs2_46_30_T18]|nr:GNAT family N-acetyltransferase ['Osedax' symbiont bacterium Rs2_46_30_T18]
MTYTINALQLEDREQWQRLYYGYAEFYQVPMNQKILDQVWSWIFADDQPFYALIAKDEKGQAVGLMHYRGMPSPLRGATVGFLDDLYVDPNTRGSGVVDLMFERLQQQAKAHSWPFVRWITAENNYRGRAVYDRLAEKTQWQTYQLPAAK